MEVVQNMCPKDAVKIEMPPDEDYDWDEAVRKEAALAEEAEAAKTAENFHSQSTLHGTDSSELNYFRKRLYLKFRHTQDN